MNGKALFRGGFSTCIAGVVLGAAGAYISGPDTGALIAGVMIAFGIIVASVATAYTETTSTDGGRL